MDGERSMTKSELIELIAAKQSHLPAKDVDLALIFDVLHHIENQIGRAHV